MAFFVFGHMLPPFFWNGGIFLIWVATAFACVVLFMCLIVILILDLDDDAFSDTKLKIKNSGKTERYYQIDIIFDLVMLFVLAGLGFYGYAILYAITNVLMYIFRRSLTE